MADHGCVKSRASFESPSAITVGQPFDDTRIHEIGAHSANRVTIR